MLKYGLAAITCLALLSAAILAGSYLLLQGENGKGTAVIARIEAGIQNIVGDDFELQLQNANLAFSGDARVVFRSNDVEITRKSDGELLSSIGFVEARLNLFQALTGKTSIEVIRISNATLFASSLGTGQGVFLPTHFDKPFNVMGRTLATFQNALNENRFEQFEIVNSEIVGKVLGRKQEDPIRLDYLSISPDGEGRFRLDSNLQTQLSNIEIKSSYEWQEGDGSAYSFKATGVRMREWFSQPDVEDGVIGSDATVALAGNIPFDNNNIALDPTLNIKTGKSTLRLGREAITTVNGLDLNLRIIMAKNQIELDPSNVQIGRLNATWVGGIKPYNTTLGYSGSLRYDLIMQKGTFAPTIPNEKVIPAGFKIDGLYNVSDKDLLIDNILLKTQGGEVSGKGQILFGGVTPSLKAEAKTDGISILAVKQFWPFFMAGGAREWFHSQFIGGRIEEGTLAVDIPPGKIFKIREGVKVKPEEFNLKLKLNDAAFQPFGELPPIRNGKGGLEISGMRIVANITSGKASSDGKNPVSIKSGTFTMKDYAATPKFAETKLSLEGRAESIAKISNRKPLRVMERMKVTPEQFSGKGYADIVARFPIAKGTQYSEVDWNVLLDLQNASSSVKLAGRKFTDANIVIDATPISAKVIGKAKIDGVQSRLNLVEPIGKSGKAKRKREIRATLGDKARKALGIDLNPVITGPIDVTIVQQDGIDKYNVNLSNATVSLPWVGWSKGKGIAAKASFDLKIDKEIFRLNNLKISGNGFNSESNMVLTRKGLISADIKNLSLNGGDNIRLKIKREKNVYNINATGRSYDARGVLNTLLYQASFNKAEGNRSVNLTANFNRIVGFGKRTLNNVGMVYQSRNGILTLLDMKASGSNNAVYNVKARKEGNQTRFSINSNNAGNALAFANIYTKMEGGNITANLVQNKSGPYLGPVRLEKFTVVNEPRLANLSTSVRTQLPSGRSDVQKIIPKSTDRRVTFDFAQANIDKGEGYLKVKDTVIRNNIIGLSMDGLVYNQKDYMSLVGTFMPANGLNLAIASIPLFGRFFANGKDRALIGITYKLQGARNNPELLVNPLSIVTPGFFNKVFEFK